MDTSRHDLTTLFLQLGLPADEASIAQFIVDHSPIPEHVPLSEASFWNPSQATFLKQGIEEDSDWAEIIDHLDVWLRG